MGAVVAFDPKSIDYDGLPDIASAALPQAYQQAKFALSECQRIDELKDWADKAAALASYARMAADETLEKMAMRIRARAIRRAGELLEQIKPAVNQHDVGRAGAGAHPSTAGRMKAAEDAGLSPHQTKNAIRVARIPDADFNQQIESDDPPTVDALAAQGTRKVGSKQAALRAMREAQSELEEPAEVQLGTRTPAEYQAASQLVGMVDELVREANTLDLDTAVRGLIESERRYLADLVDRAAEWLSVVATRAGLNV
jgi:hypothetical protein